MMTDWIALYGPWLVAGVWLLGYEMYALWTQRQARRGARDKPPLKTLSEIFWIAKAHWRPLSVVVAATIIVFYGHFVFNWWR